MRLRRNYKLGTLVTFKWYDDWRDEWQHPDNFRIVEGVVESNDFLESTCVYNGHENKYYSVPNSNIIKVF